MTPTDGSHTFTGVNLVTLTGNGRGAQATVGVNNGAVNSVTITGDGGNGYQTGDVVGIDTIGAGSVGRNVRLTVSGIGKTSELILDNVQGDFSIGGPQLNYFNSGRCPQTLNNDLPAAPGGNVQIVSGLMKSLMDCILVNHQNHGMYFPDNRVVIAGVLPDVKPTKLTAAYTSSSTSGLSVEDATGFSTFENVSVGTTNTGYLLVGEEIIEYTSVDGTTIGGNIARGNNPITYPAGTPVYKMNLVEFVSTELTKLIH